MADHALPNPNVGPTFVPPEQSLTTVSYRRRQLVMYPVQKHEFEILASGYSSVHLGLAGCFFGAAVTLGATIASVSLSDHAARVFTDSLIVAVAATIYCGLMAIRDYRNSRKVITAIRSETVDVVVGAVQD